MDVVWLASYPKSGNTWVRFLFTNLLHGPFERSDVIFDVTPVLERGVNPNLLREDRVNFIKTHKMFDETLPWLDQTRSIVYIVRNPFDVLLSNLNYFFLTNQGLAGRTADELQQVANSYVSAYLQSGGDPRWKKINYGSWVEHVASWVENARGIPVKAVRYEDLLADTGSALRAVCDFIGLEVDDGRLAEAVERSSFESMRAMEEHEIAQKRPGMFYNQGIESTAARGFRFMNRGKAGEAANAFSAEALRAHAKVFMPTIERFGYA